MKVAFVTGASGFIGQHLVKRLIQEKWLVYALSRSDTAAKKVKKQGVTPVRGDLTKFQSFSVPLETSHIFHLAAKVSHHWKDFPEIRKVNVSGTGNLLKRANNLRNLKQFIHLSTVGVYGPIDQPPASESSPKKPESPYEITKLEAEKLVLKYHKENDLPYTIIRPSVVFGPLDVSSPIVTMYRLIKKGIFLPIGRRSFLFQTIFVKDLITGIFLAVNNQNALNQDFIMAGKATTFLKFAQKMAKIMKRRILPGFLPIFAAKMLTHFSQWTSFLELPAPIHPHSLHFLLTNRVFSTVKAQRLLNFSVHTPLNESLSQTIKWYQLILNNDEEVKIS